MSRLDDLTAAALHASRLDLRAELRAQLDAGEDYSWGTPYRCKAEYMSDDPRGTNWQIAFIRLRDEYREIVNENLQLYDLLDEAEDKYHKVVQSVIDGFRSLERTDEELAELHEKIEASERRAEANSVVYYVKMNDHIKIGTTINIKKRMASFHLHRSALLAIEPGGRRREKERHRQFAEARVNPRNELFDPVLELMEHIKLARDTFGDPLNFM